MKTNMKKKALIAASIAGLIAASNVAVMTQAQAADEKENCYGLNACKGQGACGGKDHSCAGKNACKGMGIVQVAKGTCVEQGGKLQA